MYCYWIREERPWRPDDSAGQFWHIFSDVYLKEEKAKSGIVSRHAVQESEMLISFYSSGTFVHSSPSYVT